MLCISFSVLIYDLNVLISLNFQLNIEYLIRQYISTRRKIIKYKKRNTTKNNISPNNRWSSCIVANINFWQFNKQKH